MDKENILYNLSIAVVTALIWYNLYQAQFEEYDDNYGLLIGALILSIISFAAFSIPWFKRRVLLRKNIIQTVILCILNSPVTVGYVILNYEQIFKAQLKL